MYVDVVDIFWLESGVCQCVLHYEACTEPFWVRGGDVVCVGAHAFAHHLCINLGSASLCMLQFLENEAACTFAHDESVA